MPQARPESRMTPKLISAVIHCIAVPEDILQLPCHTGFCKTSSPSFACKNAVSLLKLHRPGVTVGCRKWSVDEQGLPLKVPLKLCS